MIFPPFQVFHVKLFSKSNLLGFIVRAYFLSRGGRNNARFRTSVFPLLGGRIERGTTSSLALSSVIVSSLGSVAAEICTIDGGFDCVAFGFCAAFAVAVLLDDTNESFPCLKFKADDLDSEDEGFETIVENLVGGWNI